MYSSCRTSHASSTCCMHAIMHWTSERRTFITDNVCLSVVVLAAPRRCRYRLHYIARHCARALQQSSDFRFLSGCASLTSYSHRAIVTQLTTIFFFRFCALSSPQDKSFELLTPVIVLGTAVWYRIMVLEPFHLPNPTHVLELRPRFSAFRTPTPNFWLC